MGKKETELKERRKRGKRRKRRRKRKKRTGKGIEAEKRTEKGKGTEEIGKGTDPEIDQGTDQGTDPGTEIGMTRGKRGRPEKNWSRIPLWHKELPIVIGDPDPDHPGTEMNVVIVTGQFILLYLLHSDLVFSTRFMFYKERCSRETSLRL